LRVLRGLKSGEVRKEARPKVTETDSLAKSRREALLTKLLRLRRHRLFLPNLDSGQVEMKSIRALARKVPFP
jgi:hypothetical protein